MKINNNNNAFDKNHHPNPNHPLWWGHYRYDSEYDRFVDECAVFGVFGVKDAASITALGLHALQHRGQEAAGIVTYSDDKKFRAHRAFGEVGEAFADEQVMRELRGNSAIGHTRYSTTGGRMIRNVQPLFAELSSGGVAMAHNGNLTNAQYLRQKLINDGAIFQSTIDSEVLLHLLSHHYGNIKQRLVNALHQITGAYAYLLLTEDSLIGVRDPFGIRPLVLGQLEGHYILASETVAFDIIGAQFIREVKAGEMVTITKDGLHSEIIFDMPQTRPCIFEYVYFSRPDSLVRGQSVHSYRRAIGRQLAMECPCADADIVIAIPDSGIPAAMGYGEQSGIAYDVGIIRNHYVGRTFIQPEDKIRHLGVKMKHNPNREIINGKKIAVIDDSLVRGTTATRLVEMLRNAGAKQVHMRIASPQVRYPCYYGIDLPTKQELLANKYANIQEMCDFIKADSLGFISVDGIYKALGEAQGRNDDAPQFTDHYFTGTYPVATTDFDDNSDLPLLKQQGLLSETR